MQIPRQGWTEEFSMTSLQYLNGPGFKNSLTNDLSEDGVKGVNASV